MDASKSKIIVICGPTATGKTRLALSLCRHFGGELVGADSMQIYQGLTVGTAAPTKEELAGIPAHLIGFLPPQHPYSVADYLANANQTIQDILRRNAIPVVCGGTGLYISSLIKGICFTDEKTTPGQSARLEADWDRLGGPALLERLARLDPQRATQLHVNDKKRILRALAESEQQGLTYEERKRRSLALGAPFAAFCIGLAFPQRTQLYQEINTRVDQMLHAGLLEEAGRVYRHRSSYKTAAQAIGYKEFFPYFAGESPMEPCIDKLKQATRNYAKRQLTWFRKMEDLHWMDADSPALVDQAIQFLSPHFPA